MNTTHCPMCGALVWIVGAPDFPGDAKPTPMHYEPKCEKFVRDLAAEKQDTKDGTAYLFVEFRKWARDLVAEMDGHE